MARNSKVNIAETKIRYEKKFRSADPPPRPPRTATAIYSDLSPTDLIDNVKTPHDSALNL